MRNEMVKEFVPKLLRDIMSLLSVTLQDQKMFTPFVIPLD